MSGPFAATARLPRSGNAALAAGAFVQAAIGAEFVLAGLSKVVDADFPTQFRSFVQSSPGAKAGPLAGVLPVVAALEVLPRRLAEPLGAQHAYEPLVALISSLAAFALGGMSLSIYLIEGARLPMVNPGFAFTSPVAIELFLVPLAFCIAFLEFARYTALRRQ